MSLQAGLEWREDSSNASAAYRRNKVRLELVPLLQELTGNGLDARLVRTRSRHTNFHTHRPPACTCQLLSGVDRRAAKGRPGDAAESFAVSQADACSQSALLRELLDGYPSSRAEPQWGPLRGAAADAGGDGDDSGSGELAPDDAAAPEQARRWRSVGSEPAMIDVSKCVSLACFAPTITAHISSLITLCISVIGSSAASHHVR